MSGSGLDWLPTMLSSFHDSPVHIAIDHVMNKLERDRVVVNSDDFWNLPFVTL